MTTPIVFFPQTVPSVIEADVVDQGNGYVAVALSPGVWVSVQPDGRIESRLAIGTWERATWVGPTVLLYAGAGTPRYLIIAARGVVAPTPPPLPDPAPGPASVVWDVPVDIDLSDPAVRRAFLERWVRLAYGTVEDGIVEMWMGYSDEMLARGAELGLVPPARYLLERVIGRGSGGTDIARYGPYAGRSEDQSSRTPWQA